jgi:MFS family permease
MRTAPNDDPAARATLWLAAAGLFLHTLDSSLVNVALPGMAAALGIDPLAMHSVPLAYLLTVAVVTPLSGSLADRFGLRRIYTGGLLLFCGGALLCAMSTGLGMLLLARAVQALGGAMLMPLGRLAVLRSYPMDRRTAALAFVGLPALVGPLMGPALGGLLVEHAGWRWIFIVLLPPALATAALVHRRMPPFARVASHPFDLRGYLLIVAAVLAAILGMRSLSDGRAALGGGLLIAGAALAACYFAHARTSAGALLPLHPFRNPQYAVGMAGSFIARIGSGAMPFLLAMLLQVGLAFDPARAGLMMLAASMGAFGSKSMAEVLIRRIGHAELLVANTVLLGLLIAGFAFASRAIPVAWVLVYLALYGAVNSLQFTCMNTFTLASVDDASASAANSSLALAVQLSACVAVSMAGLFLQTASQFGAAPLDAIRMALVGIALCSAAAAFVFGRAKRSLR